MAGRVSLGGRSSTGGRESTGGEVSVGGRGAVGGGGSSGGEVESTGGSWLCSVGNDISLVISMLVSHTAVQPDLYLVHF